MIAYLNVPSGTDISVIESQYPDLYLVDENDTNDGENYRDFYAIGDDDAEEDSPEEFLTYDDAVAFIGFAEGAISTADAYLDGNGEWAEGMIRRRGFSEFATDDNTKARWQRTSDNYWAAYERGKNAAQKARGEA